MSEVHFRVVENVDDVLEHLDEFAELYNDYRNSAKMIRDHFGWSSGKYSRAKLLALDENLIEPGRKPNHLYGVAKYHSYHKQSGRYHVYAPISAGRFQVFCETEEQAKELVEKLKKVDWDKRFLPEFKKELGL